MNRDFLRQAQRIQAQIAKAQEELAQATVEGSAGGGVVRVVMTGQMKLQEVKISPEVLEAGDLGLLEDLVLAAVNEAVEKSQALAASKLGAAAGGLNIPGLGG